MGVHGLWDVIAPCGRRTSVDALARKRLAVDASIWLIQFVKAMRDDSGEMLRNAPLLGLFRRLCKLLFLHVQPVLVFDGVTPEIKRRTVSRRRAFRERQEASLQRTAEKILLNQLKGRHLLQGVAGGPQRPAQPGATVVGAGVALVPHREASTSSKRARMPSTKQPMSCPGFVGISLLRWSARTDAHRPHRYMIHSGSHRLYVLPMHPGDVQRHSQRSAISKHPHDTCARSFER